MKKWAYISGFIFAALLLCFTYFKVNDRPMPEALFYLFIIAAAIFFFTLVFAVLKRPNNK